MQTKTRIVFRIKRVTTTRIIFRIKWVKLKVGSHGYLHNISASELFSNKLQIKKCSHSVWLDVSSKSGSGGVILMSDCSLLIRCLLLHPVCLFFIFSCTFRRSVTCQVYRFDKQTFCIITYYLLAVMSRMFRLI